jgi:hypothetical protein
MRKHKTKSSSKDRSGLFGPLEKLIDQQQTKIRSALDKLKDVISQESSETKEMLETYSRFLNGKATEQEMDAANQQMRDLLRVVGLGFLAALPLAPLTIPLVVKLGERFGIKVLPSSFERRERGPTKDSE